MTNIPESWKTVNELFPGYLAGKLERAKRHDDYIKLLKALNDIIREARCKRSKYLPKGKRPDDFLLSHFEPLLERKVSHLFKKFFRLRNQANQEQTDMQKAKGRNVSIEETATFLNWLNNAELVFKAIVLGPKDIKTIREKEDGKTEESKYFEDISLRINSHRAKLLGQAKKANKENLHLRFAAATAESIDAADEISQKYKAYSPKQNPYFDEPAHYDPDYKKPEWRTLLSQQNMALTILDGWQRGEYPEIQTKNACIEWVQSNFTDGKTIEELDHGIQSHEEAAEQNPPNFILHIRGKGRKQQGFVYERLRQLAYWHIKKEGVRRNTEIQNILMDDVVSEDELLEQIEDDVISKAMYSKDSLLRKNSLWREDEAAQVRPVIHKKTP